MLAIDVISAYVICGAGALAGAAMLRLADSPQPDAAAALRICNWALRVLGGGLLSLLLPGSAEQPLVQVALCAGTLACMTLCGWGLGRLAGESVSLPVMGTVGVAMGVLTLVAMPYGPRGLAITLALGLVVTGVLAVWLVRRFILAPPDLSARVMGLLMVALALSSLVRLVLALRHEGVSHSHLLLMPAAAQSVFAVFYGVLPVVMATLLMVRVNAQLRQNLNDRALKDELTGLYTRRAMREMAPERIAQARRSRLGVAVMMLDLDHFKRINDGLGHGAGDLVLRQVASLLRENARPDTLLARYGGEEFVVLSPVEDLRAARRLAERLRLAIADAPWTEITHGAAGVTLSAGVTLVEIGESLDDALRRADAALYRAKREGRNQVQVGVEAA